MERPGKTPYVEKVYTEIAPGHLDIHHPKERLVVPKEETIPPSDAVSAEKHVEEPVHASEPVHHEIHHTHEEETHREKHAAPEVHAPAKHTFRTEAASAPSIRHAYRGGTYRGMRFARGLGLGTGILVLSPFALLFGATAGMWWLTGQIPVFKKKGGHEKGGHEKKEKKEKKDDHGHGGGHGHH